MAITLVQNSASVATGTTSVTPTLPSGSTAGNLLVIFIASNASININTRAPTGWSTVIADGHSGIYYIANCSAGITSEAITGLTSAGGSSAFMAEFSGVATSTPLDTSGTAGAIFNSSPQTATTSGNVSTAGSLALGAVGDILSKNGTTTLGDGFTQILNNGGTSIVAHILGSWTTNPTTGTTLSNTGTDSSMNLTELDITVAVFKPHPAPTVALNSPADTATGVSTTPALQFTGTADADITYEVQVDTVNTFDSQILDSYSETNRDGFGTTYSDTNYVAQSFTGNGSPITSITVYLKKNSTNSYTGNIVINLYAHSGTFGTSSIPTGGILATSDAYDSSNLTTSFQLIKFIFSNPIILTNGTNYCFSVDYLAGNATDSVQVGWDGSSPTAPGNASVFSGGSWAAQARDVIYYIEYPLIDATSASGGHDAAQFSGTPDNTDPFASGQAVTFTVPSGETLTASTTYYWRVRGKDPSGSNTFGSWSSTRSFTVGGGTSTVSITKSLKYTIKVTPTAPTKSLKYTTKTTPAAKTKSLQYAIKRTPAALTKSLKYTVKATHAAITKALKYTNLTTPSAKTKSLKYDIFLGSHSITKSLRYAAKPTTDITKTLKYTVKTTPSALAKSLKYTIRTTPTALTKSLKYTVKTSTAKTKGLIYDVKTTHATITKSLAYYIGIARPITKSLKYTVPHTPVAPTKSLKYTVIRTPSALTKSLKYAIKTTPSALTKQLRYDIQLPLVTLTKTLHYEILTSTPITKALKYTVIKTPSALAKSLKYTVIKTPSAIAKSLEYDLSGASHDITLSLKYAVITSTALTKSLHYAVKAPVAITKSLKYTVVAPATAITKSLKYTVIRTPAATTKQLKYLIKTTPGVLTKSLRYDLKLPSTKITKSLAYEIKTATAITKQLTYSLPATTHDLTKALKYTVRTTKSLTKTLEYTIKTTPGAITKALSYRIKAPHSITKSLKYEVKASRTIAKNLTYAVIKTAPTITKPLAYYIRSTGAITKVLRYALLKPRQITKPLTYEIIAPKAITKPLTYRLVVPSAITLSLHYTTRRSPALTLQLQYRLNIAARRGHKLELGQNELGLYLLSNPQELNLGTIGNPLNLGTDAKQLEMSNDPESVNMVN